MNCGEIIPEKSFVHIISFLWKASSEYYYNESDKIEDKSMATLDANGVRTKLKDRSTLFGSTKVKVPHAPDGNNASAIV